VVEASIDPARATVAPRTMEGNSMGLCADGRVVVRLVP
jgi:hypothetical protein